MKDKVGIQLFNTPAESGLRSLIILNTIAPKSFDLQRLVIYDYLLVHSGDVHEGPESLHPPTPQRAGELLVRRDLIEHGLLLLFGKGLVSKSYVSDGIVYSTTSIAGRFLTYLTSPYATRCVEVSRWIVDRFSGFSDIQLRAFVNENMGRWGAEFDRDPTLWEGMQ